MILLTRSLRLSARLLIVVLFVMPVASGCSTFGSDGNAEELQLTRDRATYQAGESVTLRLVNETRAPVGYNLCGSQLQVRDEGEWIPLEVARGCITVLQTLEPGERTTYAYPLPERLNAPRRYRLRTTVQVRDADGEGRSRTLTTQSFSVEPSSGDRR